MTPCHVVEITTPKRYLLRGLWFGPKRAKRVVVWVHGMGSSVFSKTELAEQIADKTTAVLLFNNRGHDIISRLRHFKKEKSILVGTAHEKFSDSFDDIQGAINFARKNKAKQIYLAGHSTGCQKSIYWAHKKKGKGVRGVILLAPVSDYAAETKLHGSRKITRAARVARALIARGKKHTLLPEGVWHETLDAQRFLSLYTPDSIEEIFPYAQPKKNPRILNSVQVPVLVFWAAKDEFGGGVASKRITTWFETHLKKGNVRVIPNVGHGFRGGERPVVRAIRAWMK